MYIHTASGTTGVQKVCKTGPQIDIRFVAGLEVTGTPPPKRIRQQGPVRKGV